MQGFENKKVEQTNNMDLLQKAGKKLLREQERVRQLVSWVQLLYTSVSNLMYCLVKMGKDEVVHDDDAFKTYGANFVKQQATAQRLQKDTAAYLKTVKATAEASKQLGL